MKIVDTLEDDPIWQIGEAIAEQVYARLEEIPEEDEWTIQSRLRSRAFELTADIADACGAIDPRDQKWAYGQARRDLFVIKSTYILASKIQCLALNPQAIVDINKAIQRIDSELQELPQAIRSWFQEMSDKKEQTS
jgi:hypothetical protein